MKLLLEPMESQKLNVVLISTSNEGQAFGQIILQRQHSCEKSVVSAQKLIIKILINIDV